jgi:hypothetical protein
MSEKYTKTARILKMWWTRWNSSQMCLASLMRVHRVCDTLYMQWHVDNEWPNELDCFGEEFFWRGVGIGHDLVLPLVCASLLLESDGVTMSDATYLCYEKYY